MAVAVAAMIITCITASMAGYALAKKRFRGRGILFSLIVCAMALPKQVILIPLIKEISALFMWDNLQREQEQQRENHQNNNGHDPIGGCTFGS